MVIRGTMLNKARFLRGSVLSRRGHDAASGTAVHREGRLSPECREASRSKLCEESSPPAPSASARAAGAAAQQPHVFQRF